MKSNILTIKLTGKNGFEIAHVVYTNQDVIKRLQEIAYDMQKKENSRGAVPKR